MHDDPVLPVPKLRSKPITVWVTEDEYDLYKLLSAEYGIKMNREMYSIFAKRLKFLQKTLNEKI